jgi:hypothetical protein
LKCESPGYSGFQILSLNGVDLEIVSYHSKDKDFVIKDVFENGFLESTIKKSKYFTAVEEDSSLYLSFKV